jgi:hypothetical protein
MKAKPSATVTVAAIVGICLAAFTILGCGFAIIGLGTLQLPSATSTPSFVKSLTLASMVIGCGVAIFGIVTCAGVLRLKNWARISLLVWASVMAFFSGFAILFMIFVPFPAGPTSSPVDSGVVRAIGMFVYGVPLLIGIWWLMLFNQRSVKEQFLSAGVSGTEAASSALQTPRCPLPLAVLAWIFIVSMPVSLLFFSILHLPIMMILFGHVLHGRLGAVLLFSSAFLNLLGAIGLLKLQRWSYPLTLGLYFFWMVSSAVSILSPRYEQNMRDVFSQMGIPEGIVAQTTYAQTRTLGILSLLPAILIIWLFLYYHTRFMDACAAKKAPNLQK